MRNPAKRDPYANMYMTRRDLDAVRDSVSTGQSYLAGRDRGPLHFEKPVMKDVLEKGRRSFGIGAGALGIGYLQGRLNSVRVLGTPVPTGLAAALGLWGAAAFGGHYLGAFAEDVHNAGDGAFASWLTVLGLGWGQQSRLDAGQPTGPIVAGALPSYESASRVSARPLTEAEVIAARR